MLRITKLGWDLIVSRWEFGKQSLVGQADRQEYLIAPPDVAVRIGPLRAQSLCKPDRLAGFGVSHQTDLDSRLFLKCVNNRPGNRLIDARVEDDFGRLLSLAANELN